MFIFNIKYIIIILILELLLEFAIYFRSYYIYTDMHKYYIHIPTAQPPTSFLNAQDFHEAYA